MKKVLTPSRTLAATLLLGGTSCAWALSLGTPASDAWIGRPLQMTVPASFGGAAPDDECVQADVFYGDSRLPPSAVRATVVGPAGDRQVRVEAQPLIDEPVVTVSLRAGCRNSVTRNYTLLPGLPSEAMVAAWSRPAAPTVVAHAASVPLHLATSTAAPEHRARRVPTVVAAAAAGESPVPRIRTRAARPAHPHVSAGARLKLEPIDIDPPGSLLRVSTELANPTGDPAQRATAALMWQAINADPQQVLRTSAMLQELEREMAQLQQSSKQTHAEILALRQRLDRAKQPWYVTSGVVQLLALLVLATGAAAGLLWLRTRRDGQLEAAWYEPVPARREPSAGMDADVAEVRREVPSATPVAKPQPAQPTAVPVPARVEVPPRAPAIAAMGATTATGTATPTPTVTAKPAAQGPIDFELPVPSTTKAPARASSGLLRVETLAATFEEVEFLASLGLSNDAQDVLKSYLEDSASPAPLAFYELMRLCDHDDDASAVAAVRRRYRQVFRMDAPEVEQVKAPRGLDSFVALSARITRAWGQREAVDVIEQALFDAPLPGTALTLQAGRELITLHDLAMALLTDAGPSDTDAHPLAPWAHAEDAAQAHLAAQDHADAEGGHRFALDIDLTAAPEALPEKPPVVEVGPLLAELQAASAREAAQRRQQEEEDAFSAAVASERIPVSRL